MAQFINIDIEYKPQPKQVMLHDCPANEVLYGGSAGPGKSHSLRYEALRWGQLIPGLQIYLFRRTYPELERNHILQILSDWGNRYGNWSGVKKRYELPNGSLIHACHAQYDKDVMLYHGAEIHLLLIDELTTFSEWQYVYLRNRVRCTLDIPPEYRHKIPGIVCGSNPGGIGHEFCKRSWVDFCRIDSAEADLHKRLGLLVYEHVSHKTGEHVAYGIREASKAEGGMRRAYIPALLEDNQILMTRDPGYIDRVRAMPEPYRSAYLDGDWELFIGQMFSFNRLQHVCKPFSIPAYAPLYFTFDWGFGKPFSCGWWFVDADGRIFRFGELYGWTGTPDVGLRKTDSEIAEMIISKEIDLGLRDDRAQWSQEHIVRLCDPTCMNKKPDYKGGGQGPSTAEVFAGHGLIMQPGDPSRLLKIRQFHERLKVPKDGTLPMMMIFDTCKQFIRTIPLLQQDEHNCEDVDTKMEDHIYDEASHIAMARPLNLQVPPAKKDPYERRIDALKNRSGGNFEDYAAIDHLKTIDDIIRQDDGEYTYDDIDTFN